MRGHDPDEQVVLSGGPGPQVAGFAQVPELAGLEHPVRLAADQHAPAAPERLVEMVGLERDRIIAVRGDQRTGAGPQHDGAGYQEVVHRQDHQPGDGGEGEPAEAARREQPVALGQAERFELADRAGTAAGRRVAAGAEQRGRRGAQCRRQPPQRARVRLAGEALQVLQVAAVDRRALGHLAEAEPQFGPPRRQPPAEVAGIGRRRPVVRIPRRPGGRFAYQTHSHRIHLTFHRSVTASFPARPCREEGHSAC